MSFTPNSKGRKKQKNEASISCTFNEYDYEGVNYLDSYQLKQYIRDKYKLDLPDYVVKQIINDKVIGSDKVHVHKEDFPVVDNYIKKTQEELRTSYGFTEVEKLGVYNQEREYEKHGFLLEFPKLRNEPRLLTSIQSGNKISGYTFQASVSRPFSDSSIVMTNYLKPLDQLSVPSPYFQSDCFKSLMKEFSDSQEALGKSTLTEPKFLYFTPLYQQYTLRSLDKSIFEFLSPDDSIAYLPVSKKDEKSELITYKIEINSISFEEDNNENLLIQFFFYDKSTETKITETCGIYRVDRELQHGFVLFECTSELMKNAFMVIRIARESDSLFEYAKKQYDGTFLKNRQNKQNIIQSDILSRPPSTTRTSESTLIGSQPIGRFSEPPVPIKSSSTISIKSKKNEDIRYIKKPEIICIGVAKDNHSDPKAFTFSGELVMGDNWQTRMKQYNPQNGVGTTVLGMFGISPIILGSFKCTVMKLSKEWNASYKVFDCCRNQTMVMGDENIYSLEYLEKREKAKTVNDMYFDSLFIYLDEINLGKDKRHEFFNVTAKLLNAQDSSQVLKVFYPPTFKESLQNEFISSSYSSLKTVQMDDEIKIKLPTPIEKSYYILFTVTEYCVNSPSIIEKQRFAILPLYDNKKPIGNKTVSLKLGSTLPQIKLPTTLDLVDRGSSLTVTIKSLATGYASHIELFDYFATKGCDNVCNLMNIPRATLMEYFAPILQKELQNIKSIAVDVKKVMDLINFLDYVCPVDYPTTKPIVLQKFITTFNPLIIEPLEFANYVLTVIINVLQSFNDSHKIFDLFWFFLGLVEKSIVAYLQTKRAANLKESVIYSGISVTQLEENLYIIANVFGGWMVLNQHRITPHLISLVHANIYFAEFMRSMLYLWRLGKIAEVIEKYLNVVSLPIISTGLDNKGFVNLPYLLRFDFLNILRDFDYLYEKDCPKPLVFKETAELPDIMEREHFFHGLLIRQYIKLIVKDIQETDKDQDNHTKSLKFTISKMAILSIGSITEKYDTFKHYETLKSQIAALMFPLISYAIEEKSYFENSFNVPYGLFIKDQSKWNTEDFKEVFVWKVFYTSLIWVLKNIDKETLLLYFQKEVSTRVCDLLFHLTNAIRFTSLITSKKFNINVEYDSTRLQLINTILKDSPITTANIPLFQSRIILIDVSDEFTSQLGLMDRSWVKRRGTLATSTEQRSFHNSGLKGQIPKKCRRSIGKTDEIDSNLDTTLSSPNNLSSLPSHQISVDDNISSKNKVKKPTKFIGNFTMKITESAEGLGRSVVGGAESVVAGINKVVTGKGRKKTGSVNHSDITELSDTTSSDDIKRSGKENMAMLVVQHFLLRSVLRTIMDCIDMLMNQRDITNSDIENCLSKLLYAAVIEIPLNGIVILPIVDFLYMIIILHFPLIIKSEELSQCILKSLLKMANSSETLLRIFSSRLIYLTLKSEFVFSNKTSLTSSNLGGLVAQWSSHHVTKLKKSISEMPAICSQFIHSNDIALKNALIMANSNIYDDYIWILRSQELSNGISLGSFNDVCGFLRRCLEIASEGFQAEDKVVTTLSTNNTTFLTEYHVDVFNSVPFDRLLITKMAQFCTRRFTGSLKDSALQLITSISKEYESFFDEFNMRKIGTQKVQASLKTQYAICTKAKALGEEILNWARKTSFLECYFEEPMEDKELKTIHQRLANSICQANEESTKLLDQYDEICSAIGEINPLFPISVEEMKKMVKMVIELLEEQISKIQQIIEVRKNYEQKRVEIDALNAENARIIKTNINAISKSLSNGPVSVKYFSARILELKNLEEITKDIRTRRSQRQGEFSGFMAPWESFFFYWESVLKKGLELSCIIEALMLRIEANKKELKLAEEYQIQQEKFARASFKTYAWVEMSMFLKSLKIDERSEYLFLMDDIVQRMKKIKIEDDIIDKMNSIIINYNKINQQKELLFSQFKADLQKNGCFKINEFQITDITGNSICSVDHGIKPEPFGKNWYEHIINKNTDNNLSQFNKSITWLISYEEGHDKRMKVEAEFETQRKLFSDSLKLLVSTYNKTVNENNIQQLTQIIDSIDSIAVQNIPEIVKYCVPFEVPVSINSIKKQIKEFKRLSGTVQAEGKNNEIIKPEEDLEEKKKKDKMINDLYSLFLDNSNCFRTTSIIDNSLYLTRKFDKEFSKTIKIAQDILNKQEELWRYDKKSGKEEIKDIDELLELLAIDAKQYVNAPMLFLTWVEQSAEINRKYNRHVVAGICEVMCMNYIYCILRDSQQAENLDLFDISVIEDLFADVLVSADISLVASYSSCSFESMIKHAWLAVHDFELSEQWFAHQMCCFLLPYYDCSSNIIELAKVHETLTKVCENMSKSGHPLYFYHVHFALNSGMKEDNKPCHYIYSSLLNYDEFVTDIKKTPIAQRAKIVESPNDETSEKIVIQQVYIYSNNKVIREQPVRFTPVGEFVYECDVLYSNQRENKLDGSSSLSTLSHIGDVNGLLLENTPLLQIGMTRLILNTQSKLPSSKRRVAVTKRKMITLTPIEKAIDYITRVIDNLEEFNTHIIESQKNNETFDFQVQEEIKKVLYHILCDDKWKLCDVAKAFLIDDIDEAVSTTIKKYLELYDMLTKVEKSVKRTVDLFILGDPEAERIEEISRIKKYFLLFVNNLTVGKGLLEKRKQEVD
ncbi:hypothetical protein EHI8A_020720 [Entamoeba histolytica HM-1:IMSS-B]|uniref:DOCKER domain-containing protein n=4 Tax=Entamoeba histolytica TaxID=5759 RepID=A0A175JK81_ENTHI|nr:Hypothetical protein EHI5A_002700 [Entamoeba histolytica KU27]EMH73192.1 hypothetical protein EHI8A_020720 [Entamoeba histolytica HM-1:IMSS-B]EMS15692.1 hypothetical protein KM1_003670 [Entamoeba histolytica HM-3:IMSS]GAT94037.1 hypothetical protein conserved [Entamoeba histolytica]